MSELLLGDEAVGLAAIHAGISGVFSYPGTPATEILEFIRRRTAKDGEITSDWQANEKVAYEEALGMSFAGRRALVTMKHVGLNVAADPFINSALTGANGGLVVVVADDPGMHSSQNEQDTRYYGDFARILVLEPSNQQEAYDVTREAFELSEELELPVLVRLVTRLAHSRAQVVPSAPAKLERGVRLAEKPADWTLLPVNARRRFRRLIDMQPKLREVAERSPHNRLELKGPKGIIATGLAYNYVREVLGTDSAYSLLKISVYPTPAGLVRRLVDHCDEVLVVEEGYPFVERQLNGLLGVPGKAIRGKLTGALPPDGELNADLVRVALGLPALEAQEAVADLPLRPPALCQGCPHCDTFKAIIEATASTKGRVLFSDIGCYTLGALPPYSAVHSCVDMGSSISMAHGAAKAGVYPVICTIGDSTFTHSGMTPLIGAVREDADMTVFILDNATVAMTGGQETLATGEQLLRLLMVLGVKQEHLVVMDPKPSKHEENTELVRREINHHGLSVIVAARACIQVARKVAKKKQPAAKAAAAP